MRHHRTKRVTKVRSKAPLIIFAVIGLLLISLPLLDKFSNREVKILFVGDIFFDRSIRQVAEKKGGDYLFECIDELLDKPHAVVGNLEGPITNFPSRSVGSAVGSADNFIFTFPTTSAQLLARRNFKVVSLGNNHIGNFGRQGIEQTKKYLAEAGVGFFGGLTGDEPVYRTEIHGKEITFIAYNQFGGDSVNAVVQKIKKAEADYPESTTIVFAHWGEEYIEPTRHMRDAAKRFAEAGASVVIGSHPHVVQGSEKIGDTIVYYSLGNFMFDQYWEDAVRTGLAVELTFSKSSITAQEYFLDIERSGQTCLK